MSCKEHDFSKVGRISVYALADTPFSTPVYSASLYPPSAVTLPDDKKITNIPFVRDTAKCSDKSTRSVSGITHQVNLTWDSTPLSKADLNLLTTLQQGIYEVIITYFGEQKKVIRTSEEGYAFDFQDDNGVMKCSMTLTNGQGLTSIL